MFFEGHCSIDDTVNCSNPPVIATRTLDLNGSFLLESMFHAPLQLKAAWAWVGDDGSSFFWKDKSNESDVRDFIDCLVPGGPGWWVDCDGPRRQPGRLD
jgi:hypothetical protein